MFLNYNLFLISVTDLKNTRIFFVRLINKHVFITNVNRMSGVLKCEDRILQTTNYSFKVLKRDNSALNYYHGNIEKQLYNKAETNILISNCNFIL